MRSYITSIMTIFAMLFFCAPVFAASNHEIQQELKALGNMLGYSLGCDSDRLGKNFSDPEQAVFMQRAFPKYKTLGADAEKIFNFSLREGLLAIGASGGAQCDKAIASLISMYRSLGLSGDAYVAALSQAYAEQDQPVSADNPEKNCESKTFSSTVVTGKLYGLSVEENECYGKILLVNGEKAVASYNCGDMEDYKKLIGGSVQATRETAQYWDEHDSECVTKTHIISIIPIKPAE